jgi:hypothetical protein
MRKEFISMHLTYRKIISFANYIINNEVIRTEHYAWNIFLGGAMK